MRQGCRPSLQDPLRPPRRLGPHGACRMTTALIALGLYAVIVAGLLWSNHRWHALAQREAEVVNWLPFLPPVPAPREPDADWVLVWPQHDAPEWDPCWWVADDEVVAS